MWIFKNGPLELVSLRRINARQRPGALLDVNSPGTSQIYLFCCCHVYLFAFFLFRIQTREVGNGKHPEGIHKALKNVLS